MATPFLYNNTTTQLPQIPKHIDPPGQAVLLKDFAHGGKRFVMGQQDTATSLFNTLYPDARDQVGRDIAGGASHLQAHLAGRPGGYPKPGDVVEIPDFWDYAGRASPAALKKANDVIERQESGRCERSAQEHATREADGQTRLASVIAPARISAGIGFRGQGHQVVNLGPAIYGRRW